MSRRIRELPNLGVKSERMLEAVGIKDARSLMDIGAVEAYLKVWQAGPRPSLNLLWAMQAAIEGVHWTRLSPDVRESLLMAVDAYADQRDQGLDEPPPDAQSRP